MSQPFTLEERQTLINNGMSEREVEEYEKLLSFSHRDLTSKQEGRLTFLMLKSSIRRFEPGERVRFKYIILGQEGCEGVITEVKGNPVILRVLLDRGFDWWAPSSDWNRVEKKPPLGFWNTNLIRLKQWWHECLTSFSQWL